MKKVWTTLVAVAMLAGIAGSASAVTCTLDRKPAATLLIPYFQVQETTSSPSAVGVVTPVSFSDTLVTIVNASAANTLAHITVWNRRSVPVLDFNVGLTGFDVYPFSVAGVLSGHIPNNDPNNDGNMCADSSFVRFTPTAFPTTNDSSATTVYGSPAFDQAFALLLASELDGTDDCPSPGDSASSLSADPDTLTGYITIDMVNFCTFANPSDISYWNDNAAGFENSFWGDYIIETPAGVPTYGAPSIPLEADIIGLNGDLASEGSPLRTFYARYWEDDSGLVSDTGGANGGAAYFASIGMPLSDVIIGDMREPLGITWGARYLNVDANTTSFLRAWRASADSLTDLTGGSPSCTAVEPSVLTVLWDEDETPNQQTGCTVSPCPVNQPLNFPFETQRENIAEFAPTQAAAAGWVYVDFSNSSDGTVLDQAWLGYDLQAPGAFLNVGVDGVNFDANSCVPAPYAGLVVDVLPEVPTPLNADGITGSGF